MTTLNTDIGLDNSALPKHIMIKMAVAAEAAKPEKKAALKPLQAVGKTVSDMGGGDKKATVDVLKHGNAFLMTCADTAVYKAYKVLLNNTLKTQGYHIGLNGHPVLLLTNTPAKSANDDDAQAAAFTE